MEIKYRITEYFKNNNLFDDNSISDGLKIKEEGNAVLIEGDKRDLVMLADLLCNVALEKDTGAHVHIDDLTLLSSNSKIKEVIISKN